MKPREFAAILRGLAAVLAAARAQGTSEAIGSLATIFDADSAASVAKFVERVSKLPAPDTSGDPRLGELGGILSALRAMLDPVAKAPALADLEAVAVFFQGRPSTGLEGLAAIARAVAPRAPARRGGAARRDLNADLVEQYRQKLQSSLGNDAVFGALFDQLQADDAMAVPELAALAKAMAGSAPRGRAAALKKIYSLHQALMTFKAKDRATAGRSAA